MPRREVVETLKINIVVVERILIPAMAMRPGQALPVGRSVAPQTQVGLRGVRVHHHRRLLTGEKNLGLGVHLFLR